MIWRKLGLNPYSEQVSYMSKCNARISTLAVSHVNMLVTEWLYVNRLTGTL